MSLLDNIEARFTGVAERVVTDAEKLGRSETAQALIAAGKAVLPFLPEGAEAEAFIAKLQEAEAWAHRALATLAPPAAPAAPAPAADPTAATGAAATTPSSAPAESAAAAEPPAAPPAA